MKLLKYSSLLIFFILTFSACKNDLKLNAPYKEIPSVYALMNPNERMQMIRINKVFLGEGDANVMAKNADSVNYKADEITVSLTRTLYGTQADAGRYAGVAKKVVLFHDSIIETAAGAFNSTQRVYITYDSLYKNGVYKLEIKNNHTGNVFTATTTAIAEVQASSQLSSLFSAPFYPFPPTTNPSSPPYIDYYSPTQLQKPYEIRFTPNEAEIYKVTIRMHFYDSLYSGGKVFRYVDYTGGNIEKKGSSVLSMTFRSTDIFNAAAYGLARLGLSNDIYGRKMERIEYIFNSSTAEYVDYLQYVAPSFNISQVKPLYSNFKDQAALGIFTFRTTLSISKNPNTTFASAFSDNPNTCGYKFFAYSGASFVLKGCK